MCDSVEHELQNQKQQRWMNTSPLHTQATLVNTFSNSAVTWCYPLKLCEDGQFSAVRPCSSLICAKTQQTAESKETHTSLAVYQKFNYKLVIMTAWVQLNNPVWVSYKHEQREPIISSRRLQRRDPVAQLEPAWEVLRLTGEVQRKHRADQVLPSSLLFNLITVMSLETVAYTTSNVEAHKHTVTGNWIPSAHQAQTQHG